MGLALVAFDSHSISNKLLIDAFLSITSSGYNLTTVTKVTTEEDTNDIEAGPL